MSFPIPSRGTSQRQGPIHSRNHSLSRPHSHHGQAAAPSLPSQTWNQRTSSSQTTSTIGAPHRRTSSASLKLVPLINKFEDLDALSLDLNRAPPDGLKPAPLHIPRKRPRGEEKQDNVLSTIFSPDIRSYEDGEDVFIGPVNGAETGTVTPPARDSDSTEMGVEPYRQVDDETHMILTPGLVQESNRLEVPLRAIAKDAGFKRVESLSIKDKIKMFDKAVTSVSPNVKEPSLGMTPVIPVTPKKQIISGSPLSRPSERTKPRMHLFPATPTKSPNSSAVKKPVPASITSPNPHNFTTPMKSPPNLTSPTTKYSVSPPKVKLMDVYTDNSHLSARGRALLRKETLVPDIGSEKKWSPIKPLLSPSKPGSSPQKDNCRGNSVVQIDSEHHPIHTRRRNLSDKIHTIYRARSQRNSPSQIANTDGNESRHPSKIVVPEKEVAAGKSAGRIGSKIAALRRLFDGGSQSKSLNSRTAGLTATKTLDGRDDQIMRNRESDRPLPLSSHRPQMQTLASSLLETTDTKQTNEPDFTLSEMPTTNKGPVPSKRASIIGHQQRVKTKIGDRIKLFESISRGKEKFERRFRHSGSSSTKTPTSNNPFRRETRGSIYSELTDATEHFSSSMANSDGAREGKRKSLVGMWNGMKPKTTIGRGGSSSDINKTSSIAAATTIYEDERGELLTVKEVQVQCGLKEPKPLRLAEMKKVVQLCKDFGARVGSSGNVSASESIGGSIGTKEKSGEWLGKENGSRDTLRVPP